MMGRTTDGSSRPGRYRGALRVPADGERRAHCRDARGGTRTHTGFPTGS